MLIALTVVGCRTRLTDFTTEVEPEAPEYCPQDLLTEGGQQLGRPVDQLALGNHFSCARAGGDVFCWGANLEGHLGDGTVISRARPSQVKIKDATDIGSGSGFESCFSDEPGSHFGSRGSNTCARLADGRVSCWGTNVAFDDVPLTDHPALVPTLVAGLSDVTQASVSGWHGCARIADGTARCWGRRQDSLGDGLPFADRTTGPVVVLGLSNVRQVITGNFHSCAALDDGSVSCWGYGEHGELGDGMKKSRPRPAPVPGLGNVAMIATTWHITCALLVDGTVDCWGYGLGEDGLLGAYPQEQPLPVKVAGLRDATQIAVAGAYACAALIDGGVACWGRMLFRLFPAGTTPPRPQPPARVPGLANIVEVQVATDHACARDQAGAVWCWGSNFAGQLGDGTTIRSDTPVRVL